MAGRNVQGKDSSFTLTKYIWRNKPTRSPLTGNHIRCLIGADDNGRFWAGIREASGEKARFCFNDEPSVDVKAAQLKSREMARELLEGEITGLADKPSQVGPGEVIARVEMDDGWAVELRQARRLAAPEKAAQKSQAQNIKPKKGMAWGKRGR